MFIKKLKLLNFRSYQNLELEFGSKLIFFIGENGSGKTNILESINQFATLKSFRDNPEEELINWKENFFYIKLDFVKENFDNKIEIGYSKEDSSKRKVKLNQNQVKKKQEIVGELKTVIFSPNDLSILDGGPAERRRFIDTFISIQSKNYYSQISEYNKILKQRNFLLKKKNIDQKEFSPWNKLLKDRAEIVFEFRKDYILRINEIFKKDLFKLSNGKDQFEIIYKPDFQSYSEYEEILKSKLAKDIQLGYTSVGIHRDQIFIGTNGKDITEFGSQGQKRSTVISLKTSQFHIIKSESNLSPILLIDDVIRELDVKRRELFIELIKEAGQTFFTTTDLEGIKDYLGSLENEKEIFEVKDFSVKKLSSILVI